MEKGFVRAGIACAVVSLGLFSGVRDAAACGGCFHPSTEQGSSVITDHRMVLKVSQAETILWDQVRYSGSPSEFAWVLPVRAGARVELSRDEWIAALDASTLTTVRGPDVSCQQFIQPSNGGGGGSSTSSSSGGGYSAGGGGGGGGCGSSSSSSSVSYPDAGSSRRSPPPPEPPPSEGDDGGFAGNDEVQVVSQSVIGPYQAVTIHSTDGGGIGKWLTDNGFAIPDAVKPIVDAYTQGGFDFIALRLRPDASVRAMRPVRVITPGADITLPLRMVAAGVGAHVGLTLWVIGEGRYHTQNFPDAPLDWSSLRWNAGENRSNLKELTAAALTADDGRGWLTETSTTADVSTNYAYGPNPTLYNAFHSQCAYLPARTVPCDPSELTTPDTDAGAPDAGDDGGDAGDAGTTGCTKVVTGCDDFDDLDVATRGLHPTDIWVTRLRAYLPIGALSVDLRLEATPDQSSIDPLHQTTNFTDPSFDPCAAFKTTPPSNPPPPSSPPPAPPSSSSDDGCACRSAPIQEDAGTAFLILLGAVGARAVARRRERK
jgi:MYXO-CTERM domain-containing protein